MKYCSKCGNANADESVFCASCGTPLEQAPAAPAAPEPTAAPAPEQPAQPAYTAPTYTAPTYDASAYSAPAAPAPEGEKNTSTLWLILNIVSTLLCCPGGIFGIIGIILAAIGMGSFKKGDYEDMKKKSKTAMIMFIVNLVLGLIGWIVGIILIVVISNNSY